MITFIKEIFGFLPPEGNAAIIFAIVIVFFFFAERFLKWFLVFYSNKQKEKNKEERNRYEKELREKELEIQKLQNQTSSESNKEIIERINQTYEKIKDLNNNNTGVTREEFDSLVSQIRSTESMTRTELNNLSAKVNQILGRLGAPNDK